MDNLHVVSANWLHEHLHDPQVVVVDCRFSLMDIELGHKQYQENHIESAYYLDLNFDLSSLVLCRSMVVDTLYQMLPN